MKSTDNILTESEIADLRTRGLVHSAEFAYRAGDLIVAENPVTGEKRVVGKNTVLAENNKRVLKG